MAQRDLRGQRFTIYGWLQCVWVLIISFQYGYHISVLNQIQAVLTCKYRDDLPPDNSKFGLPRCIAMSDRTFGFVTSIFTIGGLLGSLFANKVMDRYGRRSAARYSALFTILGTGMMGFSSSVITLGLGRLLVGVGAGIGLVCTPIFLSEISPVTISGNVGVLLQLSIVTAIMFTQLLGFRFATPGQWRNVLFFSFALSLFQFAISIFASESPAWLQGNRLHEQRQNVALKLWGSQPEAHPRGETQVDLEADPLLEELEERRTDERVSALSVPDLFKAQDLRRPLFIVCLAMASQQLSGINAVLYYSNDILSKSLPDYAPWVSLGITIVNFIMTFPPIILVERVGRRPLLAISTLGAVVSLICVGLGLDFGLTGFTGVAIMTFVSSFAMGLGPVPFLLISEVSPYHAVSALSSVALSLNWVANFFIGLVFYLLRDLLSGGDVQKEGRVFYVFAVILFISMYSLSRVYKG